MNDCTCLGYTQTYECSISGGGLTVWNGSAFDCLHTQNGISLRHSQFVDSQAAGECNNGTVIASSIGISGGCYVSQLNITITPERVNESIMCAHHDVQQYETTIIGQTVLEITMGKPLLLEVLFRCDLFIIAIIAYTTVTVTFNYADYYPPPSGVHLESVQSNQLLFTWNEVNAQCSSVRYIITAKNCGVCPRNTTNTSIICSISPQTRGECMFAVQTEICRSLIGERSKYVIVNLYGKYLQIHACNLFYLCMIL